MKGGCSSKCLNWFITISLVVLAVIIIILTIGGKQNRESFELDEEYDNYEDYGYTTPTDKESFEVVSSGMDGEFSLNNFDTEYDKLVNELTKWRVESKRKFKENNLKPTQKIDKLMKDVSKFIEHNTHRKIERRPDTDIIHANKNEILDMLNNSIQKHTDTKPDDSGKYTYTVEDKMYT